MTFITPYTKAKVESIITGSGRLQQKMQAHTSISKKNPLKPSSGTDIMYTENSLQQGSRDIVLATIMALHSYSEV